MSILIFIILLSFLVIIHELGHFLAARAVKMKVDEFGVGYPPRALKLFTWKKTLFSLNWIPFGGFVKIQGEDNPVGYFHQFSTLQRLLVIVSGAAVNFIFGMVAFAIVFSIIGIPTSTRQPRVAEISPNSPAAEVSLPTNVNILGLKINDDLINTNTTDEVIQAVNQHRGNQVTILTTGECQAQACQEKVQEFDVYLRTVEETPADQGALGVIFAGVIYQQYPWYQMPFRGAWQGLLQAFWLSGLILQSLGQLMADLVSSGHLPADIAGPVGIVHQASSQGILTEGVLALLSFGGMLSINLAIMNLLPIPALDGGRALFVILETIFGKSKTQRAESVANYIGYGLLLGLIVVITARDIWQLFG